jgi:molybdopterin-biosynthesis enzyme MoeA-like protein
LPHLTGGAPLYSQSLRIERGEGEIAVPLGELAREYPDLHFGSYPFHQQGVHGTNVVVRGTDVATVNAAMARLGDLAG